ncbi:hypothetical protein [Planctellipticum variicoloris]|uniref:hypothetical protein n=1 Tax=Planctellipticum variicoloris TaxID=3064265 RepID=UPI00301372DD|nr:hypothetical protein SH412_002550 [Planctomycetaceae bacterium SH412]
MMAMQVVYAVTSGGGDMYSAMTHVSAASVRLSNPSARIVVACDVVTAGSLKAAKSPLVDEVDQLLVCETPDGDATFRNRFVKTRLRNVVDGAFLFLDSDTLVRGDLTPVFEMQCDIAGTRNHSLQTFREQIWEADLKVLDELAWRTRDTIYVNGGVLLYQDTVVAHEFGKMWHDLWLESSRRSGGYRDQPALNAAILRSGVDLAVLDDKYNAQIRRNLAAGRGAVVWHYYSSAELAAITEFEVEVGRIADGASLDVQRIRRLMSSEHPLRRRSWLDDWFAGRMMRRAEISEIDQLWLTGRRGQFLRRKTGEILRRWGR